MMGHTHAMSGAAAGAALLPLLPIEDMWQQLTFVAVAAGWALWPDIDHPSATATRTWGPITRLAHIKVSWLADGHRRGTHDPILGPAVPALLVLAASLHPLSQAIVLAIGIGLALRAWHFIIPGRAEKSWPLNLAASTASAWWLLTHQPATAWWMPLAVGLGIAAHLVGDRLTEGSLPRPFVLITRSSQRLGRGPLTTSTWYEHLLIAPGLIALTAVCLYLHVPEIHAQLEPYVASAVAPDGAST